MYINNIAVFKKIHHLWHHIMFIFTITCITVWNILWAYICKLNSCMYIFVPQSCGGNFTTNLKLKTRPHIMVINIFSKCCLFLYIKILSIIQSYNFVIACFMFFFLLSLEYIPNCLKHFSRLCLESFALFTKFYLSFY